MLPVLERNRPIVVTRRDAARCEPPRVFQCTTAARVSVPFSKGPFAAREDVADRNDVTFLQTFLPVRNVDTPILLRVVEDKRGRRSTIIGCPQSNWNRTLV